MCCGASRAADRICAPRSPPTIRCTSFRIMAWSRSISFSRGSMPLADQELLERLHDATDLLESLASNWTVLNGLPAADRERLHRAIAHIYNPDPVARRKRWKTAVRERAATRVERT